MKKLISELTRRRGDTEFRKRLVKSITLKLNNFMQSFSDSIGWPWTSRHNRWQPQRWSDVKDENLKQDMKRAKDLLESALCGSPPDDSDDEEEMKNVGEKMEESRKILPKNFPFFPDYVDEKAYKEGRLFSYYKGPVYWMDNFRYAGVVS